MKHSIWMAPWDFAGREPAEVVAFLRDLGLDSCNLALSYHGGRMLLPLNRHHTVYEQHPGAVYFPSDLSLYKPPLRPAVGRETAFVKDFLVDCRRSLFPVWAWTVVCHNDYLGPLAPECCIENAFGERYTYALCPSHPDVQSFAATLCGEIAALPGVVGLDLEAVGFLGYEHASLHGKSGMALSRDAVRALSVCFCRYCRELMGGEAERIAAAARDLVRTHFQGSAREPVSGAECILEARRIAQIAMLRRIRAACPSTLLNLRLALDPWFFGGKSTLDLRDLNGLADAVTITFFGHLVDITPVPVVRPVALDAGFVFHGPDCLSAADVRERYRRLRSCAPERIVFYSFSMASGQHFEWLRETIQGGHDEPNVT